jgi:lambda repressor-like predicted transcriptional regulator
MERDPLLRVSRAAEKAATMRSELEHAIVNAKDAGHSLRLIAQLAGVSHESVRQVLRRRGGEKQQ